MSLVNYSNSSSSSEDTDSEEPKFKMAKVSIKQQSNLLPTALTLLGVSKTATKIDDFDYDDPSKHEGRTRSFRHERGNWATHVYIPVDANLFEDFTDVCQRVLDGEIELLQLTHFHISLSRTVVLQYHLIDSFAKSLQDALKPFTGFNINLSQLKVYANEDKTRTFLAFKVDELYHEKMQRILDRVNKVMGDYKLPQFYEDPSFHVSVAWCLGDKVELLNPQLPKLQEILRGSGGMDNFSLNISAIYCKCGNKDFTFKLK